MDARRIEVIAFPIFGDDGASFVKEVVKMGEGRDRASRFDGLAFDDRGRINRRTTFTKAGDGDFVSRLRGGRA